MALILASASRYRQSQLATLGLEFEVIPAEVDESPRPAEPSRTLCMRLALEKAQKVLLAHPDDTVIGADQVCVLDEEILGKPGTQTKAIEQLERLSGQQVVFYSALAVLTKDHEELLSVATEVVLRELTQTEIENYIRLDNPVDCAGALKSEQRGSLLFERVTSDDPTALIGLPLIRLAKALRQLGINPLL